MLDGLPGRQMAIDSDLHAGLIDQHEAHRRREEVYRQSDFFGAWTEPASSCAATPWPGW